MTMSVSLPAGAIVAVPTKIPIDISPYGSRIFTTLMSALGLASYFQQIFGRVLWSLSLQVALLASGVLGFSLFVSMQTCQATGLVVYHAIKLFEQAIRRLWDSAQIRRLRKKIEFEFFTLILGAGGNNLCLIVFWPGWAIIGLAIFAFSALTVG
ncbi:hypothetical protein F5B22DRAFT_389013 [Xylaria bambusicola]|uniref:uncharacterized protein n=1 Tax=Xylaria bambusicola TaxID=326684 RepID=UPI002007FE71|nr:uncharacterized protein F5B22DRAFT_389013 [Xylaria bambusicola]KAI0508713.1 hypothetical protein F5B22DRAFT_389013 [Xylaria bambusicola]